MRWHSLAAALAVLAVAWGGLLTHLLGHTFTAHMVMHMLVVAVAAPLLALAVMGSRFDSSPRLPLLFAPLPASLWELALIWAWHAPALHAFARGSTAGLILEQFSFLAAGFMLWLACIAPAARAAGVFGLLFTSMHMTLLGALLALAPRPLYAAAGHTHVFGMNAVDDQNLGGIVMLAVGGAVYLLGGLILMARLLAEPQPARPERG